MMMGGIFGKKKYNWGDPQAPVEGMPQAGAGVGMPGPEAMQQPEQPERPGFFQRPATQAGLASFTDTLTKLRAGVDPGLMRGLQHGQDREFAEAQYERQRTDEFADKMKYAQWERANPKPVNNDTANDITLMRNEVASGKMTQQQYDTWYQNNILAPKYYNGWNGQRYQEGVAANPNAPETIEWDEGGPASAPGNFPRPGQ